MAKQRHTVASLKTILNLIRLYDAKGIDFPVVIEAFFDKKVIQMSQNTDDLALISSLRSAFDTCVRSVGQNPIASKRPNEVGNYIEEPVMEAINKMPGLSAEKPKNSLGKKQVTGYPDLLVYDSLNRPTYLEVKSYNIDNVDTTQRSFYLSPSANPKVNHDARHITVGFEVELARPGHYIAKSYKIIDLYNLPCDIKLEINSDNKRMYQVCQTL